ncbi:hypothetical protein MesoLj113a_13430 [Mesorhizobium sp. 113-1-2]|nr:hypothetical protein MesoLj113a_13430 [Mesorhizobium sp. 113-1-2]
MRPVSKKSPSKLGDKKNRCVPDTVRFFATLLSPRSGFLLAGLKAMLEWIAVAREHRIQATAPAWLPIEEIATTPDQYADPPSSLSACRSVP